MTTPGALLLACDRFGIDSPLERAHFFAQCAHESCGFTVLVENLNYSREALMRVWPRRFPAELVDDYAHHPERIANRAYANRGGNGDEASGDGWKFRGRGFIQTTFHDNYQAASIALFEDLRLLAKPDALLETENAALAAGYFWHARHLNIAAGKDDLEAVTRGVNGGLNGLDDRRRWLAKFKHEFGVAA